MLLNQICGMYQIQFYFTYELNIPNAVVVLIFMQTVNDVKFES